MFERPPRFPGKVAIVTGGGSIAPGMGNGKATCVLFAREGARVLVVDQNPSAAEETVCLIRDEGGEAVAYEGDVTCEAVCAGMVQAACDRWGRLDVLVNNVGINGTIASVVDVDAAEWDHVMAVNVKAMLLASKHAIPAILRSGGGAIVNLSSIAALRTTPATAYSTSKGAVIALTMAMAGQYGPQGIRVNAVCPGWIWTPRQLHGADEESLAAVREHRRLLSPLKTEGTAWDVAHAVLFLASDEARWITGQNLVVDAGLTLELPS